VFLEVAKSPGIAHLSYILGDQNVAAVVDPRRDIEVYLEIARERNSAITHIFETHRNEDYVIGSLPLAAATGAEIYHGRALDFKYGQAVSEGQRFELGDLSLKVLETPGHTFESISIAAFDRSFGEDAVGVFTGDALFIGDVGRTDFFPDRAEEVAGLLYDSLFDKLLPLGDQTILYPAHGAGSVCGSGMASREFSTVGYERRNNPRLQMGRDEFIRFKVAEHHYKPPYFRQMENLNQFGAPLLERLPYPQPVDADQFAQRMQQGMLVLDTRSPEAIAGAFIPNSLTIPLNMIPAFAGWFVPYDTPIGLVVESNGQVEQAVRHLIRLGYDDVSAYLESGLHEWEIEGRKYDRIPTIHVRELSRRLDAHEDLVLLDVRGEEEFQKGHLPGAINIYIGELPDRIGEVPTGKPLVTFCGSGRRAVIAASFLKNHGFDDVSNCLGSMAACSALGCKTVEEMSAAGL
jgi:hydroxyacylglutathione hydrolase